MTDYFLGVSTQSMERELRSSVSRFQSPMGGVTRTLERVGSRWAGTWRWDAVAGENAARLKSFLATQRGGGNRFWAYDPGYTMRGAYSAAELLSNPEFASGTTGWGTGGPAVALTAADRVMRVTQTASATNPQARQTTTAVQYAPYAGRSIIVHGRGPTSTDYRSHFNDGVSSNDSASGAGYLSLSRVALATALDFAAYKVLTSSGQAENYFELPFTSVSRCALVDNGPNTLLRSDEFDNASWTKTRATVTANNAGAPDGTITGDDLVEDATASNSHLVEQSVTVSSAVADYAFSVALKQGSRTWAIIALMESTGSHFARAWVNLATGALGTVDVNGANWTNVRAFVAPLGNSWHKVSLVARKVSAGTTLAAEVVLSTGDGVSNYSGDGASYISAWRATLAASGVPTRLRQTTTAAVAATAQTGAAIYLKGLPASTNGLLLAGDWVEFITPTYSELKRVTAPLNSDAAGLGYLQFEPILRASPVDNAAVIIRKPMGRFMLDEPTVKWSQGRAGVYSVSFTAIEDVAT